MSNYPAWLREGHQTRREVNQQAIAHAERIIERTTGKPLAYYATRSRKAELVAYRSLFVYIAVELGASFVSAGKAIGRSPATALHAYDSYTLYSTTWEPLRLIRDKVIRHASR